MFTGIFIVAAKRTPFGTMGGVLMNKSATDLSVVASTAAIQAAGLKPEKIDSVVFGHVLTVCVLHICIYKTFITFAEHTFNFYFTVVLV